MPIFEYRCATCGARHEALLVSADESPPGCPRCGGAEVERLVSTFAVGRSPVGITATGPCGSSECACRSH